MTRDEFKAAGFIGSPNCSRLHLSRVLAIFFPYQSTTLDELGAFQANTSGVWSVFYLHASRQ